MEPNHHSSRKYQERRGRSSHTTIKADGLAPPRQPPSSERSQLQPTNIRSKISSTATSIASSLQSFRVTSLLLPSICLQTTTSPNPGSHGRPPSTDVEPCRTHLFLPTPPRCHLTSISTTTMPSPQSQKSRSFGPNTSRMAGPVGAHVRGMAFAQLGGVIVHRTSP